MLVFPVEYVRVEVPTLKTILFAFFMPVKGFHFRKYIYTDIV